MKTRGLTLGLVFLTLAATVAADQKWTIHEWGTFTSLQDENGNAIGGINTDDEPVPSFVHQLNSFALLSPAGVPGIFFKGAPRCHPDVTMRLETPVIYFHAPMLSGTETADVDVKFRGGWLTEFYPDAKPQAPGLTTNGQFNFSLITDKTESSLDWNGLKIGGKGNFVNTDAHVWTSPRAVSAENVLTTNGEAERFLFYRGVAHIDAPLKVSQEAGKARLPQPIGKSAGSKPLGVHAMWLVDIHRDGKIAFRPLPSVKLTGESDKILTTTSASFDAADYTTENFGKLKASLKSALMAEGLFDDEAQALLNTWELSYFKSAGLRVFFLVPREWTDYYLPLHISLPADIKRVMVGRIELVTPEMRERLETLADYSRTNIVKDAIQLHNDYYNRITFNFGTNRPTGQMVEEMNKDLARVNSGQIKLAAIVPVPKTYQTYLDLGRFRNALVLNAAQQSATAGITNFIATYGLWGYKPADVQ